MAIPSRLSCIRLVLFLATVILLVLAYARETREVARFDGGEVQVLRAEAYVKGLTVDSYLRRNDAIFDIYSNSPESVQIRDCYT